MKMIKVESCEKTIGENLLWCPYYRTRPNFECDKSGRKEYPYCMVQGKTKNTKTILFKSCPLEDMPSDIEKQETIAERFKRFKKQFPQWKQLNYADRVHESVIEDWIYYLEQ